VNAPENMPAPPVRPADEMCCGRGCCPCIFDYYEAALARWRERVTQAGGDPEALLKASGS